MQIVNERAPLIWEAIHKNINLKERVVVDLGCGKGDLCNYALKDKASRVIGVDNDQGELDIARKKCQYNIGLLRLLNLDLEDHFNVIMHLWDIVPDYLVERSMIDVGICTSVLPYMNDPVCTLRNYMGVFRVMFVEMQYYGDGPGIELIKNDADMNRVMFDGNGIPIGRTFINGRDKYRTIWMYINPSVSN